MPADPNAAEWYANMMGTEFGPLTGHKLRQMAGEGTLTADTPVKRGDSGPWRTAGEVKGLTFPEPEATSEPDLDEWNGEVPPEPTPPFDAADLHPDDRTGTIEGFVPDSGDADDDPGRAASERVIPRYLSQSLDVLLRGGAVLAVALALVVRFDRSAAGFGRRFKTDNAVGAVANAAEAAQASAGFWMPVLAAAALYACAVLRDIRRTVRDRTADT